MTAAWPPDRLAAIGAAAELRIAVRRADGTVAPGVPIWAVTAGGEVFVRTWYRRASGWYGRAIASPTARIAVPGVEADVVIVDVGDREDVRGAVDDAYRAKYGTGGSTDRMTGPEAAATTLRLDPLGS